MKTHDGRELFIRAWAIAGVIAAAFTLLSAEPSVAAADKIAAADKVATPKLSMPEKAESPAVTGEKLDRFFLSALADFKVTLQEKNQNEFGNGGGLNPIEGVQLRFAQNETIEDRKYTLRLKPKGFKQMQLMNSLNSGTGRIERMNSQKAISDALLERYLAAAEFVSASESYRLWSSLVTLRSKKLTMLRAAARSSTSAAIDLIEHREKVEEAEVKQALALSDRQTILASIKTLDSSFTMTEASTRDLPTPAHMLKVVSEITSSSFSGALAKEEAQRAGEALKYDLAKDTRLIEFVELSYDEFNLGKQIGFRVALNIPGLSGADPSRSEKARKLVKFEVEAREADRVDRSLQSEARESLSRAAELYKSMDALENRPSEVRLRRLIGQQDPVLAVTLQEDSIKRSLRRIEVSAKAFESYFAYLASSGALADRPKTNFLSNDLRELSL